jgi:CPA1 family monovalent cation:H+ antiporter
VISLLLAYGSYIVADALGGSGVIAVVAAGLVMGNYGRIFTMAPSARITLSAFWDVAAFLANSLIFLLIGIDLHPGELVQREMMVWILIIFGAVMVIRGVITYALLWICRAIKGLPPTRWIFVVFWGGMRGTIPIALVLALRDRGVPYPEVFGQEQAQALVFGVVLLSLLVQGLTIRPVLKWLGLAGARWDEVTLGLAAARELAARAAARELEEMKDQGEVPQSLYEELLAEVLGRKERAKAEREQVLDAHPSLQEARRRHVEVRLLEAQRVHLAQAARRGIIPEEAFHQMRDEIDARLEQEE